MFVTFEGTEGAGKSTAIASVYAELRQRGVPSVTTREPGAGPVGTRIRSILLDGGDIDARTELLLFLADRANHVATVVRPSLAEGKTVLCDRYIDSTLVYQGLVRGLDESFVRAANEFATNGLRPDLTLLFDLPAEVGIARLTSKDRMDAQPIQFHRAVRDGFHRIAAEEPERFVILDASVAPQLVAEQAMSAIVARL